MTNALEYKFTFGQKLSEKHLDEFIDDFYRQYDRIKKFNGLFVFDISEIEWIANQELLVLSGLLKYLILNEIRFKVYFLKQGSTYQINRRKAVQIVEIWDTWGIHKITTTENITEYFDINGGVVTRLKTQFSINSQTNKIYHRYGITPFLQLSKIKGYEDKRLEEMLRQIYQLNIATSDVLELYNCEMPFQNSTLNSIVTKELYENFLDHAKPGIFEISDEAFMSLSLKIRLNIDKFGEGKVQNLLEANFADESVPEAKNFYYDTKVKRFKNQSVLQLSFVDFGDGIANSLLPLYEKENPESFSEAHLKQHIDTRVLEFAFRHNASRHPINQRYLQGNYIPRGLFDVLSIVKRFGGLMVARSNYGKVLFDFSTNKSPDKAVAYFGKRDNFFPGTLISIYFPERARNQKIEATVITPLLKDFNFSYKKLKKRISLFQLQKKISALKLEKENLYNAVFEQLISELSGHKDNTLTYIDFEGYELDEGISKKIIYFLIADYNINQHNTIIVINPPPKDFLDSIATELLLLSEVIKSYKIHPTPFVYYDKVGHELSLYWLGVFNDSDIIKLNDLILEFHDLRKSDFKAPDQVFGNVNYFDVHGNLKSFVSRSELVEVFSNEILESKDDQIKNIIEGGLTRPEQTIFFCNGNYYQDEYLQLSDVLEDSVNLNFLSNELFSKLFSVLNKNIIDLVVGVTASSQKLIDYLLANEIFEDSKIIQLSNYHSFYGERSFLERVKPGLKVLIVCDVISTGTMVSKLAQYLQLLGAKLLHVAALVDASDASFEARRKPRRGSVNRLRELQITALHQMPILKYTRNEKSVELTDLSYDVIRINPYTNAPITLRIDYAEREKTVRLDNGEFLKLIHNEHVKAGYFKFNNLIHPYFFDMDNVLADSAVSINLLKKLFEKIEPQYLEGVEVILYPKNSGIANINFNYLKDEILKNQGLQIIQLERFATNEGWRFPDSTKFLRAATKGRKVMVLDDGSCSGDSIMQMIDEAALLNVSEIIVLSIIARINDHKRDFLSRLKDLKTSHGNIKVSIFFGTHWHVPTYFIEDGPIIQERRWLETIDELNNLPDQIKKIAASIREELDFRNIDQKGSRFLLKRRDSEPIIKELMLTKEIIGKITSYRFYEDYFHFFNDIISTYQVITYSKNRYQKIELICAVFLHEPYLYSKVRTILPDLIERLEDFTETILFGNPDRDMRRLPLKMLYYDWGNKDVIHLFFIVFEDEALFEILNSENLNIMIRDFGKSDSDLYYLMLRLLRYVPLKTNDVNKVKFFGQLLDLIGAVIEKADLDQNKIRKLKRFRVFLNTLPNKENEFNTALNGLNTIYNDLTKNSFHNSSISYQQDVLETQFELLADAYDRKLEMKAELTWDKISPFYTSLISFSDSFPEFFHCCDDHIYANLSSAKSSLSRLHTVVSDKFSVIGPGTDFMQLKHTVNKMYWQFIHSSSEYYEIFDTTVTSNFLELYEDFKFLLKKEYPSIEIKEALLPKKNCSLAIPPYYLTNVFFKEVIKNFRHCDVSKPVYIDFTDNPNQLGIKMMNIKKVLLDNSQKIKKKKKNQDTGGGEGLRKLGKLNVIPGHPVTYNHFTLKDNSNNEQFNQVLELKKI